MRSRIRSRRRSTDSNRPESLGQGWTVFGGRRQAWQRPTDLNRYLDVVPKGSWRSPHRKHSQSPVEEGSPLFLGPPAAALPPRLRSLPQTLLNWNGQQLIATNTTRPSLEAKLDWHPADEQQHTGTTIHVLPSQFAIPQRTPAGPGVVTPYTILWSKTRATDRCRSLVLSRG